MLMMLDSGVADPGCLSRIQDLDFFHPRSRIRIRTTELMNYLDIRTSAADPLHFGVDPDPRIHASD